MTICVTILPILTSRCDPEAGSNCSFERLESTCLEESAVSSIRFLPPRSTLLENFARTRQVHSNCDYYHWICWRHEVQEALSHAAFDTAILANRASRYRRTPDYRRSTRAVRHRNNRLWPFWRVGSLSSAW